MAEDFTGLSLAWRAAAVYRFWPFYIGILAPGVAGEENVYDPERWTC